MQSKPSTTFDIRYDPAHLLKAERSRFYEQYKLEIETTFRKYGISKESFRVTLLHHKQMHSMQQSIEQTQIRYIRYHLKQLRQRKEQLEQMRTSHVWGWRAGDLDPNHWCQAKNNELDHVIDLIDRLSMPARYWNDDDQPQWLK